MSLRSSVRRVIGTGLKGTAAVADRVVSPPSGIVILIYHRVGARTPSNVDLPRGLFDEQIGELAAAGRIISLDDAVARLRSSGSSGSSDEVEVSPPSVVITFDDGTADWVEEALPVLVSHDAPATFYVATDFVENARSFPSDGAPVSWGGLAEMVDTGLVTIGSHTHTHALLDRVGSSHAADELDRSITLVGERLGVECRHFAYPKALLGSPAAEAEVRSRFDSATIARTLANPTGSDLHRLTRTPVQVTDKMRWFRHKADGGLRLEDRARQIVAGRRYAGATT